MAEGLRSRKREVGDKKRDSETEVGVKAGGEDGVGGSRSLRAGFFTMVSIFPAVLTFAVFPPSASARHSILISLLLSVGGLVLTLRLIPVAMTYMLKRSLFGLDINKRGTPGGQVKVPEAMGLVAGIVYLVCIIVFQHFYYTPDSSWLVEYNAALASICFMLFLGFIDDVLDVPWRVKLLLPSVAALPLLMAYAGPTSIIIPKPLRGVTGLEVIDLGWVYKLYMGLLAVFCTNSVNIFAGVNGLEAGQTVILASAVLVHNLSQLGGIPGVQHPLPDELEQAHLFSIYLMLPLIATTAGLLAFNWYPSAVFVGDTFTYFSGMALAVVGILGHFSETLLLFFLPQVINFIYSTPQLFKIVHCPRHRLPSFNPKTGLLTGSNDLNLVNLFLRVFGPCTEQQLCIRLLMFQGACCAAGFVVRFLLMGIYK